jgi:nucleoside-diphosphate kinase
MVKEQTIIFIDPASIKRSITGKILDFVMRTDLEIIGMKMFVPTKRFIEDYCKIKKSKISRDYVRAKYLGKRVMVIALEGEFAIQKIKDITGRVSVENMQWKGTQIRRMFYGGGRIEWKSFKRIFENVVQISADRHEARALLNLVWKKYKHIGNSLKELFGYTRGDNEKTFIILKPEAIENRLVGKIIDDLSRADFKIVGIKISRPNIEQVKNHYSEHEGKPFFEGLVDHLSGIDNPAVDTKIITLVYQGPRYKVVSAVREIIGHKDPSQAKIGTIRRSFGKSLDANVIHASAGIQETMKEISVWEGNNELLSPIL